MPYLTGDEIPEDLCTITIPIPNDAVFRRAVWGALLDLTYAHNWEQHGTVTPAEQAAAFLDAYLAGNAEGCTVQHKHDIGEIVPFAVDYAPLPYILCDGQAISRTHFNLLYDWLGLAFGTGDNFTTFNVPDLRYRGLIGMGQLDGIITNPMAFPANPFGTMEHTLLTAEIPIHNHRQVTTTAAPAVNFAAGTGNLTNQQAVSGGTAPNVTQNTGGGQPHNNMPPVMPVAYYIYSGQFDPP